MIPTLRHIQKQQVLDNLAEFLTDNDAVPLQVCITGGGAQAANQLQPSFAFPFHGWMGNQASVQIQGQWTENRSLAPVYDADDLRRLRALYRYAVGAIDKDQLNKEYPPALTKKDPSGNPSGTTIVTKHYKDLRGQDQTYDVTVAISVGLSPFVDLNPDELEALHGFSKLTKSVGYSEKCVHLAKEIWISKNAALDKFMLLVVAATPNTIAQAVAAGKARLPRFYSRQFNKAKDLVQQCRLFCWFVAVS